MLKLLDCYVLRAIGQLDEEAETALWRMEPALAGAFNIDGQWFDIVAAQMDFPAHLPEKIKDIWLTGKAKATEMGLTVDPMEFTRQFVDTNFAP